MSGKKLPDINYLKSKLVQAMTQLASVTPEQAYNMRKSNTDRWICSMLSISGSELPHNSALTLISGENVPEATIEDCRLAEAFRQMRVEFDNLCDLQTITDINVIRRFHSIIAGTDTPADFRKGNPRIKEMDFSPPHSSEVPELMRSLEIDMASYRLSADAVSAAAHIHDMIMSIRPFDEFSEATAYAVMSYELLLSGYPLPTLQITAYEHLRLAAEFVHAGTSDGLTSMLLINFLNECRVPK
jgi:Fic family protein